MRRMRFVGKVVELVNTNLRVPKFRQTFEIAKSDSIPVEILIICISAVLIFLLLRVCLHFVGVCQERKGYEEF